MTQPIDRFAPVTLETVVLLAFARNIQTPIRYTVEERQIERYWHDHLEWLAGREEGDVLKDYVRSLFLREYHKGRIRIRRLRNGH